MTSGNQKLINRKVPALLVVIAGIILGQAILYGPSLIGKKLLLPLDLLTQPGFYIPPSPETAQIVPHDKMLFDLVTQFEPARRFAVSELHQGRLPLWVPYQYGGAPSVWPKYSLFLLLECCTSSPVILAWAQLFAALVGGLGMYCFCRQALQVNFWPSAVGAWLYPLTAFFALWQGTLMVWSVYWLPWILLLVDKTVRGLNPLAPLGLGGVTFLVLTGGQIDVAGQVLFGSGVYAVWRLVDAYLEKIPHPKLWKAGARLMAGWGLGFMLAAPHTLPLLEYARTGSRMGHRSEGTEERPPVGLFALPQVVLPDLYGSSERGSTFIFSGGEPNLQESTTAAYAGVLATLLVAPLAWCSRRHRSFNAFWVFLALLGLSWCLDVPVFVDVLRLPGLNMMSHNRLVFLTSFAMLALTAVGLDVLWNNQIKRRWWFWLPAVLLAALGGWCVYRSIVLPGPIATQAQYDVYRQQLSSAQITTDVSQIQAWFVRHYVIMAGFCLLGFIGWLLVWFQKLSRLFPVLTVLLMGDLLWFDYGRSSQCDPSLYYPEIPALREVAQSVPGRVICVECLPASLVVMQGLNDIRGYDAIDPARMVTLLKTAAEPNVGFSYATTQLMAPKGRAIPPDSVKLMPVMDMLDVRYAIFRGIPLTSFHPRFRWKDYSVLINSNALARVYVPRTVEVATSDEEELAALASPQFQPAVVAYVESPVELPADCRGTVQITNEVPTHIKIAVQMETAGLVVLADNWDKGWRAYWNGKPVPVLRANYAVRGVVLPAGNGTLEFVYRPASLILGLWLAGLAVVILLGWLIVIKIRMVKTRVLPLSDQ